MKINSLKIALFIILFSFISFVSGTLSAKAANPLDVVINEIAWMGTQASYHDEWIELYNTTSSPINLDGWLLVAQDGTPDINLTGTVAANGYYLLERTDDTTVPDIAADQIYAGALGNSGEYLKLFDAQNNLIDEINCSEGWFAGDNKTKQTMERKNPQDSGNNESNWQTSQNSGGTPKSQNSTGQFSEPVCEPNKEICDGADNDCDDLVDEDLGETTCGIEACTVTVMNCINGVAQICTPGLPTEEICDGIDNDCNGEIDEGNTCETPEPAPEPEPEPEPIIYPSNIFINEFLPSPEGSDTEQEWVEILNQNNFEVNLFGWQIQDMKGRIKNYKFSQETKIGSQQFLVLSRLTTKITLNNDGDGLNLIQPNGNIVSQVSYDKALTGSSYNRTNSGWIWGTALTPGSVNIIPTQASIENKEATNRTTEISKKELAQLSQPFRSSFVMLIALAVAVFSGIVILFLKNKLI